MDEDVFSISLPPCPYPGLRPFDLSEWPIFFGRERMVDAVVGRLVTQQFIAVHGDSGAGKSSLIRAGVLPRLAQDQARGGSRWRTCIAQPGDTPLRNLARALARLDGRENDAEHALALRRALNLGGRAPAALAGLLGLSGEGEQLCILVDQFEELFQAARQGEAEARLLADALVAAAEAPVPGLYIALTLRSEFLGACARFPGLAEAVNVHQYLLPPMATEDLLRAIREPALLYGGEVETALAERLAQDAQGPDGLPLVQHALMLMHAERTPGDAWRLGSAAYPADGLAALLSRHADAVAAQIAAELPEWPRLVEDLFRALTTVSAEGLALRRPQPLGRLAAVCGVPPPALMQAVDRLRADGVSFLTPRPDKPLGPDERIDIGHEALIRSWHALADPVDGWLQREFRNGLVWRSMLVQADSFERDAANVLSEATSEERAVWMKRRTAPWAERYGGGWQRVQALLRASEGAARQLATDRAEHRLADLERAQLKRTTRRGIAVTAALGLLAIASVYFWLQAEQGRRLAEERAAKLEAAGVQTVSNYRAVTDAKGELERALQTSSSDAELRKALGSVQKQIDGAADGLQAAAADLAPRVYIHIANERQRDAAVRFGKLLEQQRLDATRIFVPGVQRVEKQANAGVLRCFRAAECRDDAPRLLELANRLLVSPTLTLQDLSSQYGNDKSIRPMHFEVWFGSAEVSLRPGY